MNVLLTGATGMVGQGVLRECLLDARIDQVTTLGRSVTGQENPKLHEIAQADLFDLSGIEDQLTGIDVCFFCLGVSSFGMKEDAYTRVTHDLTMNVAQTLLRLNPGLVFEYVSGASTDSTEQGKSMWARVKGRTENELLRMPFRRVYMMRPGGIVPLHGIRSKTAMYQMVYTLMRPVAPWLQRRFPKYITTTAELGWAMIGVALSGSPSRVIENGELRGL
ncbi:NAD-dependent epimerase/dehydratase family protein [Granulicella arctica]|uniref:NAD-dependent epimerase/dehydratase family protein n=1 Tax=Granulicella arctica TaxID=940613 RepID=UPI0021DFA86F|nr:NAD-dependent epimerase/dehydratase family protein [Granulicella arctica]